MRGWPIPPPPNPYPCHKCGDMVRTVVTIDGRLLTINRDPDPDGFIVPWPAPTSTGLAQARVLPVKMPGDECWSKHRCR